MTKEFLQELANLQDSINTIIKNLTNDGKTLVMVTHDPNMAAFADKVIKILDGRVVDVTYNEEPAYKRPKAAKPNDNEKQGDSQQ